MSHHDVEIITYGGGDLLLMVFNAISMLFYGGKSVVDPKNWTGILVNLMLQKKQ